MMKMRGIEVILKTDESTLSAVMSVLRVPADLLGRATSARSLQRGVNRGLSFPSRSSRFIIIIIIKEDGVRGIFCEQKEEKKYQHLKSRGRLKRRDREAEESQFLTSF